MNRLTPLAAMALAVTTAVAPLSAQTLQPYAGLETRPIKALSDREIDDLKAGRGMGLALAAELNGCPGPLHVLELADALAVSEVQREIIQDLFEAMKAETIPLGERLVAQEDELDRQFAGKTITEASLLSTMETIGATQAALRAAHLKYHLATVEVLSPAQIGRYVELRGYKGDLHADTKHQHGGHQH